MVKIIVSCRKCLVCFKRLSNWLLIIFLTRERSRTLISDINLHIDHHDYTIQSVRRPWDLVQSSGNQSVSVPRTLDGLNICFRGFSFMIRRNTEYWHLSLARERKDIKLTCLFVCDVLKKFSSTWKKKQTVTWTIWFLCK